jgi:hypothetical protein
VFENRFLNGTFGPKKGEIAGGSINSRNEELHNLYFSPNIIRVIKSRKMKFEGHVTWGEEEREMLTKFWEKNLNKGDR